ncbi:Hypothetical protein EIN_249070, partial [Entamoeba invadens IP1]|jgi:tetratricopeptide (TPR) repeat protein
MNKNV